MLIKVLGAHNLETADTRHTCFLVDGRVAIDAGSLMTGLDDGEKAALGAVLLTHRHYDHMRDLPSLGLATMDQGETLGIYGLAETLEAFSSHLSDGLLYPDFTQRPSPDSPRFKLCAINPRESFCVEELEIKAIPMPHGAPAVGYILRSSEGPAVAFTGDTGGGLLPFFQDSFAPSVLFTEVTFCNAAKERARASGHLSPSMLGEELARARDGGLALPKIVVVHMDRGHEERIRQELAQVSGKLEMEITIGYQGMELRL